MALAAPKPKKKKCARCRKTLDNDGVMSWFSEELICLPCADKETVLKARLKEDAKKASQAAQESKKNLEFSANELAVLVKSVNSRRKIMAKKDRFCQKNDYQHASAVIKLELAVLNKLYNRLLNTLFAKLIIPE